MKNQAAVKNNCAEDFADVLTALHEIGGDISFLYDIFHEMGDPDDNFRKIQIAVPYLKAKINFINDMMDDYAAYLPEKLKAKKAGAGNQDQTG